MAGKLFTLGEVAQILQWSYRSVRSSVDRLKLGERTSAGRLIGLSSRDLDRIKASGAPKRGNPVIVNGGIKASRHNKKAAKARWNKPI